MSAHCCKCEERREKEAFFDRMYASIAESERRLARIRIEREAYRAATANMTPEEKAAYDLEQWYECLRLYAGLTDSKDVDR